MIIDLLSRPSFWATYGVIAAFFVPVFFLANERMEWAKEWERTQTSADFPSGVACFFLGIVHAIFWPFTITGFLAAGMFELVDMGKEALKEWKARGKDQREKIVRCYRCNTMIRVADSFCPTCGADQTATKEEKR